MIKILKSQNGMTLLELFVGMMIFTIIAVSSAVIMSSTIKAYAKANDLAEINTLLDGISHEILSDLWQASDVTVSGTTLSIDRTGNTTIVYDAGTDENFGLLCRGIGGDSLTPVLDREYYKGKTVSVEYLDGDVWIDGRAPSEFVIRVTLWARDTANSADRKITSREYAVRPIGLSTY